MRMSTEDRLADDAPADNPTIGNAGKHFQELRAYFSHFLAAKADGWKVLLRRIALAVVLGVVGAIVGAVAVIYSTILVLGGLSQALAELFPRGFQWAGPLIVGGVILAGIVVGVWLVTRYVIAVSYRQTVQKYESRQHQQNVQFGRDVSTAHHD